ncbi:ANTAR domain-containing protein [Streptomyces albus]|uniref:ANTAR domain-containing protein n=1 Tax=Streptomyces albus TaxID=1888 RepID=A0A8H1QLM9_9ACTN|nr:ANTAR domain-containing protein [Streptomyces albus]
MSAASGSVNTSVAAGRARRRGVPSSAAVPAPRHERADTPGSRLAPENLDTAERQLLDEEIEQLRAEVSQLRQALDSRPVIDQARDMVMALGPCDAEVAWQVLVQVSQHSNIKLRHVAAALVAGAEGTPVPKPIRKALASALHRVRTARR